MKSNVLAMLMAMSFISINSHAVERLRLATTTSTDNSGLLAVLHPPLEQAEEIKIDVIAVGTGKALKLGENGDVDVVMVHAPAAEKKFIAAGHGVERLAVMHNDFVLLGPANDPAKIKDAATIILALQRIAENEAGFISRGDDSGTHKKEKALWESAAMTPAGKWYLAVGQGMGAVLKMADDKQAYTLTDRGTYLAYKDKISLQVVSEGDSGLFNPYHVIMVNPKKHSHIKTELAEKYINFIRGHIGQEIIRNFKKAEQPLFVPDVIN